MLTKPLIAASLRPIILTLLDSEPMYGYEIIQRVKSISDGRIDWAPGKLYPVLHSLENGNLISAFWKPSKEGPDRKYYKLTRKGREAMATEKQAWLDLNSILVRLWGPELQIRLAE